MATAAQIEQYTTALGSNEPASNRTQISQALDRAKTQLAQLGVTMDNAQAIATDHTDATAQQWVDGQPAALASAFQSNFGGPNVLAQFIADLSTRAGLEGTANELRLYKDGSVISVTQDA